jgi:hypothetical protein
MKCFWKEKLWKEEKNSLCPLSNFKPEFEEGLQINFLLLAPNFQHPMLKVKIKHYYQSGVQLTSLNHYGIWKVK